MSYSAQQAILLLLGRGYINTPSGCLNWQHQFIQMENNFITAKQDIPDIYFSFVDFLCGKVLLKSTVNFFPTVFGIADSFCAPPRSCISFFVGNVSVEIQACLTTYNLMGNGGIQSAVVFHEV